MNTMGYGINNPSPKGHEMYQNNFITTQKLETADSNDANTDRKMYKTQNIAIQSFNSPNGGMVSPAPKFAKNSPMKCIYDGSASQKIRNISQESAENYNKVNSKRCAKETGVLGKPPSSNSHTMHNNFWSENNNYNPTTGENFGQMGEDKITSESPIKNTYVSHSSSKNFLKGTASNSKGSSSRDHSKNARMDSDGEPLILDGQIGMPPQISKKNVCSTPTNQSYNSKTNLALASTTYNTIISSDILNLTSPKDQKNSSSIYEYQTQ
jgi:hypothetical protein